MKANRKYLLIFIIEILAFVAMSFMAAAVEGSHIGLFGTSTVYGIDADFWIFNIMVPLFLLIPLIMNLESKLFGVLATGYYLGIIIEDIIYYVINPYFGIYNFRKFIPNFYIWNGVWAFIMWFIFVRNSERVDAYIKKILC